MTTKNEHTDLETLAHNLTVLRRSHGYSQTTMAQLLGLALVRFESWKRA